MPQDAFTAPLDVPPCAYVANPLDRADQLRKDAQALKLLRMRSDARWLLLDELKVLTQPQGDGTPDLAWLPRAALPETQCEVFLGLDGNDAPRFAVAGRANGLDGQLIDARSFAAQVSDERTGIVAQARSLIDWHARHGFCAVCGAATVLAKAGYSRHCPACAAEHFPRTDPVVIMLALKDDRALLGRQPRFPAGFMSALAGFVEPGETLEAAVARELWEEAGIRTARVRYVASQPWPFPSSLMIGAFAEALNDEITLDRDELEEAHWFTRDEARAALAGAGPFHAPPSLAIARSLLDAWVALG